jgi:hypothetical protein
MKSALIALISVAVGCGKSPTVDKPNGGSGSMNKTPGGSATFERGPSLTPKEKLVDWMDSQKRGNEPRLLRVPIVLPHGDMGYDISKAKIGDLEVYANDSQLGVGLADRAQQKCADGPTCAFLAEGYWRGKQMGGLQFDVNKVEFLPADKLAAANFAEVEGESGN